MYLCGCSTSLLSRYPLFSITKSKTRNYMQKPQSQTTPTQPPPTTTTETTRKDYIGGSSGHHHPSFLSPLILIFPFSFPSIGDSHKNYMIDSLYFSSKCRHFNTFLGKSLNGVIVYPLGSSFSLNHYFREIMV